jgi:predicted secreted hydrolase
LIDQQTVGWDWFSIHLDNGDKLMAFVMRLDGQQDYATGTYIAQNGDQRVLLPHEISINAIRSEKVNGTTIPLEWSLRIPSKNIDIITKTTKDDQFNPARFSYYEGSIQVSGSHKGIGFMELTGY